MNSHFCYEVGRIGSDEFICVPAGFITDLASVPRLLWPIVSPTGSRTSRAAVIHDYLYRCAAMRDKYKRKDADRIMKNAIKAAGGSSTRAFVVWLALRAFGWWAWHKGGKGTDETLVLPLSEIPRLKQNSDGGLEIQANANIALAVKQLG